MKYLLLFFATLTIAGFSKKPVSLPDPEPTPPSIAKPEGRISLSWDSKEERKAWSDKWIELINIDLASYEKAGDIKRICPKFFSLNKAEKAKAIGEFWVATAFYESGFNPNSQSVDVGTKDNKDSWSVGLYQLSVRDSANKKGPNYSFNELLKPFPNIHLAHIIMKRQIENCGKLILPNSSKCRYWAVILDGNKYSKVDQILLRTKSNANFCH